ncbi:MAG: putative metalloprotease CJM1_0395 family protein [Desulfohalobiaceae bacterium]
MQSTPVPPDIAGGINPYAAAQGSQSSAQNQQAQGHQYTSPQGSRDISSSKQNHSSHLDESSSHRQTVSSDQELSPSERARLRKLQQRDREVRAHEQAHIAAGGPYVQGGANLELRLGPDGKFYAVGGEVSMDSSKIHGDPEATLEKAKILRRAALAPARPSAQDLQVAALAANMILEARQEIRQEEAGGEQNSLGQKVSSSQNGAEQNLLQPESAPAAKAKALNAYQQQQSGFGHAFAPPFHSGKLNMAHT